MQVEVPLALELVHNPQTTTEQVILDCNPSLHVVNDTKNGEQLSSLQKQQPLNVQCPADNDEIRDICIVHLKTIIPGHTDTSISSQFSDSSDSNNSTNIMGKIIPQAAHKKASTLSDSTGTNCICTLIPNEKFHSVDE